MYSSPPLSRCAGTKIKIYTRVVVTHAAGISKSLVRNGYAPVSCWRVPEIGYQTGSGLDVRLFVSLLRCPRTACQLFLLLPVAPEGGVSSKCLYLLVSSALGVPWFLGHVSPTVPLGRSVMLWPSMCAAGAVSGA